jgi:hypothetical protein
MEKRTKPAINITQGEIFFYLYSIEPRLVKTGNLDIE